MTGDLGQRWLHPSRLMDLGDLGFERPVMLGVCPIHDVDDLELRLKGYGDIGCSSRRRPDPTASHRSRARSPRRTRPGWAALA